MKAAKTQCSIWNMGMCWWRMSSNHEGGAARRRSVTWGALRSQEMVRRLRPSWWYHWAVRGLATLREKSPTVSKPAEEKWSTAPGLRARMP